MFNKLLFPIVIFALFKLICTDSPIIPEDKFKQLYPFSPVKFYLESDLKEEYFYFNNLRPDGDVAIHFARSRGFSVELFIYTSLNDIQRSENGNFTSPTWHFNLQSQQWFYISANDAKQISGKYYVIIKDTHNYYFDDYIEMFNEFDTIPLENRQPYVLKKIFTQKKYTFDFEGKENELINLNIISNNETISQNILIVDKDNQDNIILEEKGNRIQKEINIKTPKNYLMTISFSDDVPIYGEITTNIMISKYNDSKTMMNENTIYEYAYIASETFNFYFPLNNYQTNEENVITAFIDNQIKEKNYYKGFFCKYVNTESETSLLPLFPTTILDNECNIELADEYDTYYHLYFKNNKPQEQGKTLYLLISVIIDTNLEYFQPKTFTLSLSARMQHHDMSSKTSDKISLLLNNYVPYYIHYTFEPTKRESFVLYSSRPKLLTTYVGNITTQEGSINSLINTNQLFVLSNYKNQNINEAVVKLFGSTQNNNFYIELSKGEILYYNNTRPTGKTFSFYMESCSEPKYIIGNYEEISSAWLYIEELYGNFTLEYTKEFTDEEVLQSILPTFEVGINKAFHLMDTDMDLIGIKCTIPGHLNVYIVDNSVKSMLENNSKNVIKMTATNTLNIKLPAITENTQVINIEFYTPYDYEITIVLKNEEYKLTSQNHLRRITIDTFNIGEELSFSLSSDEDTIIEIILVTSKDIFKTFEDETLEKQKLKNQNLLFLLDSTTMYSDYTIDITGLPENLEYYYTLEHSPVELIEKDFIPLPQNSGVDEKHSLKETKGEIHFQFTNPYGKYKSAGFYYLTISFTSQPSSEYELLFKYNEKPIYDVIEPKTLGFISNMENTTQVFQTIDESNVNEDFFVYLTKCGEKSLTFNVNWYNQSYASTELSKNHLIYQIKNPGTELQFQISYPSEINDQYSGVYFSYDFYPNDDPVESSFEQLNNEYVKYSNDTHTISWKNMAAKNYTLYIMEKTEEREKYINNICYLETLRNGNESIIIEKLTDVTQFKFDKSGTYVANVIAYFDEPVQFKGIYNSVIITPSGKKWYENTMLLVILIISLVVIIMAIVIIMIRLKKKKLDDKDDPSGAIMSDSQSLVET